MTDHSSAAPPPPAPPTAVERALLVFVPAFWLTVAATGYAVATGVDATWQWLLLVLGLPLAWAMADLLTGLTHWGLDTYGSVETPILGQTVIQPFRMHHDHPTYMVQFDAAATIALSCAAVWPLMMGLLWVARWGGGWSVASGLATVTFVGAVCTNLFHKWAHQEDRPTVARVLQRARVILPVVEHDRHHTHPHDCAYCITCGWLNPVLDRVGFFRHLERALSACGIEPQSELYAPPR